MQGKNLENLFWLQGNSTMMQKKTKVTFQIEVISDFIALKLKFVYVNNWILNWDSCGIYLVVDLQIFVFLTIMCYVVIFIDSIKQAC